MLFETKTICIKYVCLCIADTISLSGCLIFKAAVPKMFFKASNCWFLMEILFLIYEILTKI